MKRTLLRLLVLFVVVAMVFPFAACGGDTSGNNGGNANTPGDNTGGNTTPAAKYTYRSAASNSPTTWNPHTWENNTDSIILGFTTIGFYDVQLNADKNGYEFVPEMAAAFPVDVTSEYVGKYGVEAGDTGKVWKIALNPNAKWNDGTAITADDYVYSMKEQLNPKMLNRRADSYTAGTFSVFGAKLYLYSTTAAFHDQIGKKYDSNAAAVAAGETIYVDAYGFYNAQGYVDAEGNAITQWLPVTDETVYDTPEAWEAGEAEDAFSAKELWDTYFDPTAGKYAALVEVGGQYASWLSIMVENADAGYAYEGDGTAATPGVGVFKTGDCEITVALNSEISEFNIRYSLTSNWLVKRDLYEACKVKVNDNLETSTYCTTLEKSASYGPYMLDTYVVDQHFTLKKNDNWYGYTDGKHAGQFQTTNIDYTIIQGENAKATMKELFLQGKLDDYGIDGTEMADYGTSDYLTSEPESYTFQFFMNSVLSKLQSEDDAEKQENHSVLSLSTFRKAISFAISRANYCTRFQPASQPGFGVLNYMYCIDPDTGELYRDQTAAKKTSLLYAGFEEQADGSWKDHSGESYETLDDAYEAITGYDVNYAKDLFKEAYDEAKKAGIYTDGWTVVIDVGTVGEASANFKNTFAMIEEYLKAALPENTFADIKMNIVSYPDEDSYWADLGDGKMDLSFSAWGGSAMDPWGMIFGCYIDPANSNNYGFDALSKTLDVTVGDKTHSLYDWAAWMNNHQKDDEYDKENLYTKYGAFSKQTTDYKVEVLAACELAQLNTTVNVPVFYRYTNALKSAKYNNGTDTYIQLIGFGGIRHTTYNYDDAAWDAFVASNNNNLDSFYKG